MKDSYLKDSRTLIILEKDLFRTPAVSNSVLTDSPFFKQIILSLIITLPDNDGFIVLSKISFSFKLAKYFFLDFFKSETH